MHECSFVNDHLKFMDDHQIKLIRTCVKKLTELEEYLPVLSVGTRRRNHLGPTGTDSTSDLDKPRGVMSRQYQSLETYALEHK